MQNFEAAKMTEREEVLWTFDYFVTMFKMKYSLIAANFNSATKLSLIILFVYISP